MTNRYTQSEWRAIIDQAERDHSNSIVQYKTPTIGSFDFAKCIDHTLLKLEATRDQIDQLCEEAVRHDFKVGGKDSLVHIVPPLVNLFGEAGSAVAAGATELDMVINYPLLKQQKYDQVYTDIAAVRNMAPHPVILKVILETSQLTHFDIIAGCKIAEAANADFVKTSSGFNGQGATEENVRLMKGVIKPGMKVKASGGIKTVNECIAMMEAGAERIGTSNGVWIMKEAQTMLEHTAGVKDRANSRPSDSLTRMFSSS
ncbi:MAG: hypothetical protein Q9214_002639 [Letrouitia sp. 1 TL-2023]